MFYEFLVQLEDKINTQVWCFNSEHHGKKVVFDDPTFQASCKECGSDKFLYRKNDAIMKKGHFVIFKKSGWDWGRMERKHYGIVKVDCIEAEAIEWCSGIKIMLDDKASEYDKKIAIIVERPRKYKFDYESIVPNDYDWKDQEKNSKIFELVDKKLIKETKSDNV